MSSTIKTLIVIILLGLIGTSVFFFRHTQSKLPKQVLIHTEDQPTMGKADAHIHIIAFEDLKCGNCMRFNVELFPTIKKKYIDTGRAKYTMINLAFIRGSMPAANAARCLYQQNPDFFFKFVKNIYNNQPSESKNWATIPNLIAFTKNITGVDKKKLSQCIYKSPYTNFIDNNLKKAIKITNGNVETPTIYINGYIVKPLTLKRINTIIKAVE